MAGELQVISDCYGLVHYLTQRVEKFPRHHRYSLGQAIEGRLQAVLELLIRAKYAGAGAERKRFVGARTFPGRRVLPKPVVRRFRRRLRRAARAGRGWETLRPRIAGWIGHVMPITPGGWSACWDRIRCAVPTLFRSAPAERIGEPGA